MSLKMINQIRLSWSCEWKFKKSDSVFEPIKMWWMMWITENENEMMMIKWVKGQDHICGRKEQKQSWVKSKANQIKQKRNQKRIINLTDFWECE